MSEPSRTRRFARNAGVGVLTQVLTVALSFATRTVFISTLGVELLGINALLGSILAMLALADLGINGALMYALYKPLADGDTATVSSIVRYAARMYRWIAGVVALAGLGVLPVLGQLVTLENPPPQLPLYYLALLLNSVVAYLLASRAVLLNADQRLYMTQTYTFVFNALRSLTQMAALVMFGNFMVFVVVQVAFTVMNNIYIYVRVGRLYPYLNGSRDTLDAEVRRGIGGSVKAMVVYRLGGLVLNNSDPILISAIVGTIVLGYYSNYMLVVGAIGMVIDVAFAALAPSVGNLVASQGGVAARRVLDEIALLAVLVYGTASVGLLLLLNDFIGLWLGGKFILGSLSVLAIVLNFYSGGIMAPITSFRAATGMFRQTQYVFLITAALNIALSVLLGSILGLEGILYATLFSRLMTNMWYEPYVLFRKHLGGGLLHFATIHVGTLGVLACAFAVARLSPTFFLDPRSEFVAKGVLVMVLVPTMLWFVFRRTTAWRSLKARSGRILGL